MGKTSGQGIKEVKDVFLALPFICCVIASKSVCFSNLALAGFLGTSGITPQEYFLW
jgi:hypothetical protein